MGQVNLNPENGLSQKMDLGQKYINKAWQREHAGILKPVETFSPTLIGQSLLP